MTSIRKQSIASSQGQPLTSVKRYRMRSALDSHTAEPDARQRERGLQLPANFGPHQNRETIGLLASQLRGFRPRR